VSLEFAIVKDRRSLLFNGRGWKTSLKKRYPGTQFRLTEQEQEMNKISKKYVLSL
jgi:hypothetical protein